MAEVIWFKNIRLKRNSQTRSLLLARALLHIRDTLGLVATNAGDTHGLGVGDRRRLSARNRGSTGSRHDDDKNLDC